MPPPPVFSFGFLSLSLIPLSPRYSVAMDARRCFVLERILVAPSSCKLWSPAAARNGLPAPWIRSIRPSPCPRPRRPFALLPVTGACSPPLHRPASPATNEERRRPRVDRSRAPHFCVQEQPSSLRPLQGPALRGPAPRQGPAQLPQPHAGLLQI